MQTILDKMEPKALSWLKTDSQAVRFLFDLHNILMSLFLTSIIMHIHVCLCLSI